MGIAKLPRYKNSVSRVKLLNLQAGFFVFSNVEYKVKKYKVKTGHVHNCSSTASTVRFSLPVQKFTLRLRLRLHLHLHLHPSRYLKSFYHYRLELSEYACIQV